MLRASSVPIVVNSDSADSSMSSETDTNLDSEDLGTIAGGADPIEVD